MAICSSPALQERDRLGSGRGIESQNSQLQIGANPACVRTLWTLNSYSFFLRTTAYHNGPERFVRLDGHLHLVLLNHEVQIFILAGLQHRDLYVEGRLCLCPAVSVALALLGKVSEVVLKLGEPVDVLLAFPRVALHRPLVVLSFQPLWV